MWGGERTHFPLILGHIDLAERSPGLVGSAWSSKSCAETTVRFDFAERVKRSISGKFDYLIISDSGGWASHYL